jgi:DNA-binding NarL/FixJ family response regulator
MVGNEFGTYFEINKEKVSTRGMSTTKIVFIDAQTMLVQGLSAIAENTKYPAIKIVGVHSEIEDFLNKNRNDHDIVVMDIYIERDDIFDLIRKIKKETSSKVLILSNYSEYRIVRQAMISGADGFVLKMADYSEFENAIIELMNGGTYLGTNVHLTPPASLYKKTYKIEEGPTLHLEDRIKIKNKLTKRELEILRQIIQAKTNKEIGENLFISDQTVGVHRKNIMRKLGKSSTVTLIKYVIENDLV